MKSGLPIIALVLSAIAAVVSLWPKDAPPPPPPPPRAESSVTPEELARLEQRVAALEDSTNDLWVRVARAQGAPAGDGGGAVPAGLATEVAKLRDEVHGMMAGEVLSSEAGRAQFKDAMREMQQELQGEQRAARQQQWMQAQASQTEQRAQRWKQFASDAKLTWDQEQKLNQRLAAEDKARQALMEEAQAGTKSFREVRLGLQAERRATDEAMQLVLNSDQQQQYQSVRQEDRGGFGGRGFGPGGGFPGGGRPPRNYDPPQTPP